VEGDGDILLIGKHGIVGIELDHVDWRGKRVLDPGYGNDVADGDAC
ncbi:MAG: hypothetical protein GY820_30200, partial [Gammaproteobacteria bacterium]|nr:hypothetical protein [Gammaproteobacteria bacterium]